MSGIGTKQLVSGVLLVLGASVSTAEENKHIAACHLETSSEARISCLEDAIRNLSNGTSKVADKTPEAAAADLLPLETGSQVADTTITVATAAAVQTVIDVPSTTAHSSADPVIIDAATDEQLATMTASDDVKSGSDEEPQIAPESAILLSTSEEDSSDELARLGEEQLDDPTADKSKKRILTHVVSFDFVAIERLRVRLENGQVWRQTDADRPKLSLKLRKLESFDVEMWKTGLGGYRMNILPIGRTVRVKRLR